MTNTQRLAVLFLPLWLSTLPTLVTAEGNGDGQVVLETKRMQLEIGSDGKCAALIDLRDGKDYLADERVPFASLVYAGRTHDASAVRRDGDVLHVSFGASGVSAMVRVREKPEWITFEVIGLSDEKDVQRLTFCRFVWTCRIHGMPRSFIACVTTGLRWVARS